MEKLVAVSFVIPALNEEDSIAHTLVSIKCRCEAAQLDYEVILVDNGSSDSTCEIACQYGATVLSAPGVTIGAARNFGVMSATGDIIIFVDADVVLTEAWSHNIASVLDEIRHNPSVVAGSHCSPPISNNWFLRYWFSAFSREQRGTHLGTGHLIVSCKLFNELQGFSPSLRTGEDYDFCARSIELGGIIKNVPELRVIHDGFPKSIAQFVRRECWHGLGDFQTLEAYFHSKVALATTVFLLMHLIAAFLLVSFPIKTIWLVFVMAAYLMAITAYKFSAVSVAEFLANSAIMYLYFLGRSCALFRSTIFRRPAFLN